MDPLTLISIGSFVLDIASIVLAVWFMRRERELEEENKRLQAENLWLYKHALAEAPL
jgi:hypothetical protein